MTLERALLPGLALGPFHMPGCFFLCFCFFFSLFHPFSHSPGHGLSRELVGWGGAGYKAPGTGHAELPAEKPRTCPGPASRHGLRRQAPGPPQLPDCCLGHNIGPDSSSQEIPKSKSTSTIILLSLAFPRNSRKQDPIIILWNLNIPCSDPNLLIALSLGPCKLPSHLHSDPLWNLYLGEVGMWKILTSGPGRLGSLSWLCHLLAGQPWQAT